MLKPSSQAWLVFKKSLGEGAESRAELGCLVFHGHKSKKEKLQRCHQPFSSSFFRAESSRECRAGQWSPSRAEFGLSRAAHTKGALASSAFSWENIKQNPFVSQGEAWVGILHSGSSKSEMLGGFGKSRMDGGAWPGAGTDGG